MSTWSVSGGSGYARGGFQAIEFKTDTKALGKTLQSYFQRVAEDLQEEVDELMEHRARMQIAALKRFLRHESTNRPGVGKTSGDGLYDMGHPAGHIAAGLFFKWSEDHKIQVGVHDVFGSRDDNSRLNLSDAYDVGRGTWDINLMPMAGIFRNPVRQNTKKAHSGKLMRYITSSNWFRKKTSKSTALAPQTIKHPGLPAYQYKDHFTMRFLNRIDDDFDEFRYAREQTGRYIGGRGPKNAGETWAARTGIKSAIRRGSNIQLPAGHEDPSKW